MFLCFFFVFSFFFPCLSKIWKKSAVLGKKCQPFWGGNVSRFGEKMSAVLGGKCQPFWEKKRKKMSAVLGCNHKNGVIVILIWHFFRWTKQFLLKIYSCNYPIGLFYFLWRHNHWWSQLLEYNLRLYLALPLFWIF